MRLFYDTMQTPEMIEFHIQIQGRKAMRIIQLNAYMKIDAEIIRLLKNRLSVEGDRLSDVKGITFYSKRNQMSVQYTFDLPFREESAEKELNYRIYDAREMAKKGVLEK
ncbi:MAG: hypothetical protein JSU04_00155 [Bdellovibrionales bacterium]|nr:hypothetical protein [Bdellovibrionales bacterium]